MSVYSLILIFSLLIVLVLGVFVFLLNRRIEKLVRGKNGASLEESIHEISQALATLETITQTHHEKLNSLATRSKISVRNIAVKRFSPFAEAGSNQSFSVALVDDHGDGVILSSIYARERMSVYAKPIEKGTSLYELTDEETEVLNRAKN